MGIGARLFGFVKNNPFGFGVNRIICNELVLLFLNRFYNTNIEDIDNIDLNETEAILESVEL